jgi:hypothetical protein
MRIIKALWAHSELITWTAALVLLFFMVPSHEHLTLCPLNNVGLDFCPGCGIGRSIHYAMWLNFKASFQHHPLGLFGLAVILHRIFILVVKLFKYNNHEFYTPDVNSGN